MKAVLGWDVGGANIKAACVHRDAGKEDAAFRQRPFPLWREPHNLHAVLFEMAGGFDGGRIPENMAVTMTAELADCFATKREGVLFVLDAFRKAFPGVDPMVYGADGCFRSSDVARSEPYKVAAANWMASATLVAREYPDAVFLDVGSTTADIIPIVGGRVVAKGQTDTGRLISGELVYTGILRTPVCAVLQSVSVGGEECRVAAEHFAIAADAHLWMGRITESDYTCETPDGKGRSRPEAGARLARTICADAEILGKEAITLIAEQVAAAQVRQIVDGVSQVLQRLEPKAPGTAVLAGEGVFLGRAAALRANLAVRDTAEHIGPAASVARLLAESIELADRAGPPAARP